jgi:hypothetical protein
MPQTEAAGEQANGVGPGTARAAVSVMRPAQIGEDHDLGPTVWLPYRAVQLRPQLVIISMDCRGAFYGFGSSLKPGERL